MLVSFEMDVIHILNRSAHENKQGTAWYAPHMPRLFLRLTFALLLVSSCEFKHEQSIGQIQRDSYAQTPPMGWNSWNKFRCDVSEDLIKSIADAIATNGMKDVGYQYVVIDDCWAQSRDQNGDIVADPTRFPSGIKALADYIHAKGLKFGIYSDAGSHTCAGRPGSFGHAVQDANQYAQWGVDYLKYDWCYDGENPQNAYTKMGNALIATGRTIVFSICEWGRSQPWTWAKGIGNLWRTTADFGDSWSLMLSVLHQQVGLESFAGPGHWNDPDMLQVGNGGMTLDEYRAHFSLWALLAAPLMAGNDVRSMTPEIREILTNSEVIAVNQDALGLQGLRVKREGYLEAWLKKLQGESRAVIFLNTGTIEASIELTSQDVQLPTGANATVRDLWTHQDLGAFNGHFTTSVKPHSVVMVKIY